MINKQRKILDNGVRLFCFQCGRELTMEDKCMSYRGYYGGGNRGGTYGSTIWFHKECMPDLLTFIRTDTRIFKHNEEYESCKSETNSEKSSETNTSNNC